MPRRDKSTEYLPAEVDADGAEIEAAVPQSGQNGLVMALSSRNLTNQKLTAFTMALGYIAENADKNDPDTLDSCLQNYVSLCQQADMKITNASAYLACGVTSQEVSRWRRGKGKANIDPRYQQFATRIMSMCAAFREQAGVEGRTNTVDTIFHSKVYDNMNDDPKPIREEPERESELSPEDIAAKYAYLLDTDDGGNST